MGEAARLSGDLAKAEEAFRKVIEAGADPTPLTAYQLADVLKKQNRIAEAKGLLASLLDEEDPYGQFLGHAGLVSVAVKERRWMEARTHLLSAEEIMPDDRGRWSGRLGEMAADIPGEEERAERLLREGAKAGRPWTLLRLAVLIEPRDPYEAANLIGRARREWKGKASDTDMMLQLLRKERATRRSAAGDQYLQQGQ